MLGSSLINILYKYKLWIQRDMYIMRVHIPAPARKKEWQVPGGLAVAGKTWFSTWISVTEGDMVEVTCNVWGTAEAVKLQMKFRYSIVCK